MREQQAAGVVAGGLAERASQTSALIEQLRAMNQQRAELRAARPENDRFAGASDAVKMKQRCCDDCCAALDAQVLEMHNEIRRLDGRRPLVRQPTSWVWDDPLVEQPEEPAKEPHTTNDNDAEESRGAWLL